ncbi:MAG: OpgC domain-containing protein, partial [Phycisphaerae bacterium]|nr:OpgC domain-containing protein [Phycisphaerae bacterium]
GFTSGSFPAWQICAEHQMPGVTSSPAGAGQKSPMRLDFMQELLAPVSRCSLRQNVHPSAFGRSPTSASGDLKMPTSIPSSGTQRDLRIDFFRGLALLFIFVDHVPDNVVGRFTLRNFGFADAAEVFVLLAGFSAMLAYGRTFEHQGFRAGLGRVFDRVRDIYLWHLALIVICGVGLTLAASYFANTSYANNIGVHVFSSDPVRSTVMAAALVNQPNMLNILPLYIVLLMFWLPVVLWLLPRYPWQALVLSVGLWALANLLDLNLPSQQHAKGWVFNPFAWQLLITIGAVTAHFTLKGPLPVSRLLVVVAAAYLTFSFLYVAPWTQIRGLESWRVFAPDLLGNMNKTYLSPWRLANVVALGYLAMILLSPQSQWLSRAWATGIGRCGRHSLEIFSLGTVLSFAGWVLLSEAGNGIVLQILVSILGIGIMWGTAWALALRGRGSGELAFGQAIRKYFSDRRAQQLQQA